MVQRGDAKSIVGQEPVHGGCLGRGDDDDCVDLVAFEQLRSRDAAFAHHRRVAGRFTRVAGQDAVDRQQAAGNAVVAAAGNADGDLLAGERL